MDAEWTRWAVQYVSGSKFRLFTVGSGEQGVGQESSRSGQGRAVRRLGYECPSHVSLTTPPTAVMSRLGHSHGT